MTVQNVMQYHPTALNDTDFAEIIRIASTRQPTYASAHYVILFIFALTIISIKEFADLISEVNETCTVANIHTPCHIISTKPVLSVQGRKYFYDWTNYVQIVLVCCCIGFVRFLDIPDRTNPTTIYLTYDFAAVSVFLAYLNLLRFFRPYVRETNSFLIEV